MISKVLKQEGIVSFWDQISQLPKSSNVKQHLFNSTSIPSLIVQRLKSYQERLEKVAKTFTKEFSEDFNIPSSTPSHYSQSAESLLCLLDASMVLCPRKKGLWGVNHVHRTLLGTNLEHGISDWPQGTPVMCSKNQPELGLANGDVGIVVGEGEKRRVMFRVFSEDQLLNIQLIHPARLTHFEPALAMTIHKAQGSEANDVILLWPNHHSGSPDAKNPNANDQKRLLYTAITRAKQSLELIVRREVT